MISNLKEKTAAVIGDATPLDMILEILKKSPAPMKIGELAESTGLDKTIVDKAIKALKKDGKITSPERCKYSAT